ncbi:MAG: 4Fe-4S dicluster domain-containing protein [Roseburia sp.]|nr:4Fe-4S dicluster domain-containing protein [Roseburia sp.]
MTTLKELYHKIARQELEKGRDITKQDEDQSLDCLLHPENYPPVIHTGDCVDCGEESACVKSCEFGAIEKTPEGKVRIHPESCVGCGVCVDACRLGHIKENREIYPVLKALEEGKQPVYALVAPAFTGQFGREATPGRLRSALKALGFQGMVEVAVFADILTLKEALEFDRHVKKQGDFQLTSCCCPIWISMIRGIYKELAPHVPGAVSPMIAAGRVVKKLHPDAVTVFIGPCMAKKKEAREEDIKDAVDYVLTFQETGEIFEAADLKIGELAEEEKEHSSKAGRIYARTGGVSQAVKETVNQLDPEKSIKVQAKQADGVADCKKLIEQVKNGETEANFFEGMGCKGGCVGGPKAMIPADEGKQFVEDYGEMAEFKTPLENPFVRDLLERLGFHNIMDFVENSDLLIRTF